MSAVTCACSFGPDRTGSGPCASYLVQPPSCCLTLWNQEVVAGLLLARELATLSLFVNHFRNFPESFLAIDRSAACPERQVHMHVAMQGRGRSCHRGLMFP